MKRPLILAIVVAALLTPQPIAVTEAQPSTQPSAQSSAQLPPGPRTVHQSAMEIAMPSAPFDAVQMVLDFAPGAWTPPHSHGGDLLITVLAGTMTVRGGASEGTYTTGQTWIEKSATFTLPATTDRSPPGYWPPSSCRRTRP